MPFDVCLTNDVTTSHSFVISDFNRVIMTNYFPAADLDLSLDVTDPIVVGLIAQIRGLIGVVRTMRSRAIPAPGDTEDDDFRKLRCLSL